MSKPVLAVTLGDVAGIGPEITARTLLGHPHLRERCVPVVIGDEAALRSGARVAGLDPGAVRAIREPSQATNDPATLEVVQTGPSLAHVPPGEIHPDAGEGAYRFVVAACDLARAGKVSGIVTAPLNKEALNKGGVHFPGHTEILAHLTGTKDFSMMLTSPKLSVIHVTTHIALRDIPKRVTKERVANVIALADETLKLMGIAAPRIAVAGLNPHCGEGGLFGDEDEREIVPAVREAQAKGWNVQGPIPPDSVFHRAANLNEFDIVVVMYHDQGHIPIKVLGFDCGVNVTVGLPIIRTSVDHGTAFAVAGTGKANADSMVESLKLGAQMAKVRFAEQLKD